MLGQSPNSSSFLRVSFFSPLFRVASREARHLHIRPEAGFSLYGVGCGALRVEAFRALQVHARRRTSIVALDLLFYTYTRGVMLLICVFLFDTFRKR